MVVKKLHNHSSKNAIKLFAKEALILKNIKHENIVSLIGVCEKPPSIFMELCEFSFLPFERDVSFNSLDKYLSYMDEEDLFSFFPKIGIAIAKDISCAICYLHQRDMVHRDIKPQNILVSNQHLTNNTENFNSLFEKQPIICKIGDLGEARSQIMQTNSFCMQSQTSSINRGSLAYMAPGLLVDEVKLITANTAQLKLADIWALLMTFFVLINPDQSHPSQIEICAEIGINKVVNAIDLCKTFLQRRQIPSFSDKYLISQACHNAVIRHIFYSMLKFTASERGTIKDIHSVLMKYHSSSLELHNLLVSQGTALEESDRMFAKTNNQHSKNVSPTHFYL